MEKTNQGILSGLITSRLRIDILNILLSQPEKEFYYREIVDRIGDQLRGSIARELKRLEEFGFIRKLISGKRKFYRVNDRNPIYPELRSIWMKTVGVFGQLKERLDPLKESIHYAFVYGSFATASEGAESDVDLMVIGDVGGREVSRAISDLGISLGREINYAVFSLHEVRERLKRGDHFWTRIYEEEKYFLIGDRDDFGRLGE